MNYSDIKPLGVKSSTTNKVNQMDINQIKTKPFPNVKTDISSLRMPMEQRVLDISPFDTVDRYGEFPSELLSPSDMIGENPSVVYVQQTTMPPGYRIKENTMVGGRPEYEAYLLEDDRPHPADVPKFIAPKSEVDVVKDKECKPVFWGSTCDY